MTDPNTTPNHEDSVMDSLKGAGEAFLAAGGRLGDVVGEFTQRFKADRDADQPVGLHAAADEVDENDTLGEQIKTAVARARDSFGAATNRAEYKQASASFAGDAEGIFRDLAGSVSRAARGAKDSDQAGEARASLNEAVAQIRAGFDTAVAQARERAASANDADRAESEGFIADARTRLDAMIARVSEAFDRDDADSAGAAASDDAATAAEIIDGEVVATDETPEGDHR